MNNYIELNEQDLTETNGGGVAGALVGGLLGGSIGFVAGSGAVIAGLGSGKMNGAKARGVLKDSTMGFAGIGAMAGAFSPTP